MRYGDRGRSAFARDLGIPISSLNHYETDRTPPAELLVAIARVARVSLEWLITGTGEMDLRPETSAPQASRVLDRLAVLLERSPELMPLAENFLALLESREVPDRVRARPEGSALVSQPDDLIPVVGSTAAGPARFWTEISQASTGPEVDRLLEHRLAQHALRDNVSTAPGRYEDAAGQAAASVSLVQYATPDELGFLEFVAAKDLRRKHQRAVAWRIDGDSMAPRYQDRDLVITSPDQPAVPHQPCVARQRGQIGVNCKLFVPDGEYVLLIPVNERCPVQRVAASELEWTQRVLACVHLGSGGRG